MNYVEALGLVAGFCTTIAYLPQSWQAWTTRSTKDISWLLLGFAAFGVFLWLVYGLLTGDQPITLANAATEVLVLSVIAAKLKFG